MVGQLVALNVGALCSFVLSTFNVNWSEPVAPCCNNVKGTATRLPLDDAPMLLERLELDPMPVEVLESLVPIPLDVALLLPGVPEDELLSDKTTNWIWPVAGSTIRSCT